MEEKAELKKKAAFSFAVSVSNQVVTNVNHTGKLGKKNTKITN